MVSASLMKLSSAQSNWLQALWPAGFVDHIRSVSVGQGRQVRVPGPVRRSAGEQDGNRLAQLAGESVAVMSRYAPHD